MKRSITMKILKLIIVAAITVTFAAVCLALFSPQKTRAHAETSYAQTDKLYIRLPKVDDKFIFEIYADSVNGGNSNNQSDFWTFKEAEMTVNDWFEIYIRYDSGKKWTVPTSLSSDGKYYFDPSVIKFNAPVSVYAVINEMPTGNNGGTLSFIENGDELYCWTSRTTAAPTSVECSWVSSPGFTVKAKNGVTKGWYTLEDSTAFDLSLWWVDSYNTGFTSGWTVKGPDDFATGYGLNPRTGTYKICSDLSPASVYNLNINYTVGAINGGWNYGRAQLGHRSKNCYTYDETIELDLQSDTAVRPVSDEAISQTEVSAYWAKTSAFVYATYSFNGADKGEYAPNMKLSAEGRYVITTHTCNNLTSTATLYVDKTAPKFGSEFYDAAGNPLIKYTGDSSYVLPFPVAALNDSPINQTATYVYSYYDSAAKKIITTPAEYYGNGDRLTKEGRYEFTVSDAAGNKSSCTVIIDCTAPTFSTTQYSKTSVHASYSASEAESPITSTYTLTKPSGTSAPNIYSSGMRLSSEGKYVVTAIDVAGNKSSVELYVDTKPPTVSRAFEYGKTDGKVTFSRSAYESPVSATYTLNGESKGAYSGAALSEEGKYVVTATDAAGNSAATSFVVDRTPPTLVFSDGTTGMSQITRTGSSVSWTVGAYESPIDATYSFVSADEATAPSVQSAPYLSGSTVTAEGAYSFTATDAAGNVTTATVIIDKMPPSVEFTANGSRIDKYTNAAFTANGFDALSGIDRIELYENGEYRLYDFAPRDENGAYLFRVTDKAGNITSATATVYKTDTFGNLAAIRDGYKVNAWYVVTLPARIFTTENKDMAGRYSFESYSAALDFAVSAEREFRVSEVAGGYMYVSASNEAVAQKYDSEQTLATVIEKYARGYISARQTASASGNDKYYVEPESLTRNSPSLPDYLLDYKAMPRYFLKPSVVWSVPKISYIAGMPHTVTAKFLGDFAEDKTQKEFVIPDGATLLSSAAEYKQGFYLIIELDAAGNEERYIIYSDAELPTVRAHAVFGDGESDLVLDYDYTRNETLYFVSLALERLADNADGHITLKLEKGNSQKYFTQSDALPILGSDDYTSGKYTVTVFDRSLNALIFDVYIAGAPPTMVHGSLAEDRTECKISFATSDKYNVITGISLYKIEHDGSKTVLDVDGAGTPISAATLSYVLTVGGKYGATLTDNYRRTVEIPPVFFLKGLPSGKLVGVKDSGRTNNNVSFTFDSVDVCEIYILLAGGERLPFTAYTVQTGAEQTTYNIAAGDDTSHEYLIFLHSAQDLSLFVEYTFEIDTILPEFEITDSAGNTLEPDGATNKPFSIKWSETGVSVRYYTARGGSLSATKYGMGAVLSQSTLYYFTIKDEVGNMLEFTVLLDNVVDYTIDGKYNEVDGVLYANRALTFTVNEPTQVFDVENADGFTVLNGGEITQAGRYDITVTDNYRNTVKIVIVLDFTPPTLVLDGAKPGESVKNEVTVTAENYDSLYLADAKGGKLKDMENGSALTQAGTYYVTASDYAGNSVSVSFSIDLEVDYELSVPNGGVTTGKVTLIASEPLMVDVVKDGAGMESSDKFTDVGYYELTLTDAVGNSVSRVFVIVPPRARQYGQALPSGSRITSATKDGEPFAISDVSTLSLTETGHYALTLDCNGVPVTIDLEADCTPPQVTLSKDGKDTVISAVDKDNVAFTLTKDGEEINCRVGQKLDEPGHYVLTVTDDLGNTATYEFDVPFRLNTWAIVAICVGCVVLVVVLVFIIRARRKPRMK